MLVEFKKQEHSRTTVTHETGVNVTSEIADHTSTTNRTWLVSLFAPGVAKFPDDQPGPGAGSSTLPASAIYNSHPSANTNSASRAPSKDCG